jgi:hypothetical protein
LNSVVIFNPTGLGRLRLFGRGLPSVPPLGSILGFGCHAVLCSAADAGFWLTPASAPNVMVWPGNVPPVAVIEISTLVHFPGYTNLTP